MRFTSGKIERVDSLEAARGVVRENSGQLTEVWIVSANDLGIGSRVELDETVEH